MKPKNPIHWMMDPLDTESLAILRRLYFHDRTALSKNFEIAYLIARECVEYDEKANIIAVTPKGVEAIDYYGI
jgi:hypothetical protein